MTVFLRLLKRHNDFSKKIQIVSVFYSFIFPSCNFVYFCSAYCDSVLCLVGQGFQSDDVSLMELEEVLEQNLFERWNSCDNDGIL